MKQHEEQMVAHIAERLLHDGKYSGAEISAITGLSEKTLGSIDPMGHLPEKSGKFGAPVDDIVEEICEEYHVEQIHIEQDRQLDNTIRTIAGKRSGRDIPNVEEVVENIIHEREDIRS